MGLLDNLFSDDPQKQAFLATALGLLSGSGRTNKNFGADLGSAGLLGMQTYGAAQKAERENRANELQQLIGAYKPLKDLDAQNLLTSQLPGGSPYVPIPGLQQMESRLGALMSASPMQRGAPATPMAAPQPPMPQQQPPALPPAQASQYSDAVRPEFRAQGPIPQAAPQQQADLPSMLKAANIPPQLAMNMIRGGQQAELFKMIGTALAPKNGPAGLSAIDPVTGEQRIMGGNAMPGQVPFTRNAAGALVAQPVQGAAEEVARAEGLKTGATKAAEAPYSFGTYGTGPNGAPQVMSIARLMRMEGGPPQSAAPGVARLEVTEPSRGGGLTGATPAQIAQDTELAKFHAQTYIDTQNAGRSAASGLQKLDRIDQLMQGVDTGKLTPTGMQISAFAQSLGVPIDPKLPNKQAAEALTGQIALELRNPSGGAGMPGALSDNDLKFLKSMTPGLAQTTEGRKMIIETKRKLLQRDQEVAQAARDYRKSNGGKLDDGFLQTLSDYSTAHPLFPQQQGGYKVLGVER